MIHLTNGNNGNFLTKPSANIRVQAALVIRGGYVPRRYRE